MSLPPWAGGQKAEEVPDELDPSLLVVDANPLNKWKETVDPKTKKTYWYHRETKETTWTKPTIASKPKQTLSDLPEGWTEYKAAPDAKTGQVKTYFHHKATNQTTWKRPQKVTTSGTASEPEPQTMVGFVRVKGEMAKDVQGVREFRDHHGDLMNCCKWYPKCVHKVQATRDREGGIHYKKRRLQKNDPTSNVGAPR